MVTNWIDCLICCKKSNLLDLICCSTAISINDMARIVSYVIAFLIETRVVKLQHIKIGFTWFWSMRNVPFLTTFRFISWHLYYCERKASHTGKPTLTIYLVTHTYDCWLYEECSTVDLNTLGFPWIFWVLQGKFYDVHCLNAHCFANSWQKFSIWGSSLGVIDFEYIINQ